MIIYHFGYIESDLFHIIQLFAMIVVFSLSPFISKAMEITYGYQRSSESAYFVLLTLFYYHRINRMNFGNTFIWIYTNGHFFYGYYSTLVIYLDPILYVHFFINITVSANNMHKRLQQTSYNGYINLQRM